MVYKKNRVTESERANKKIGLIQWLLCRKNWEFKKKA